MQVCVNILNILTVEHASPAAPKQGKGIRLAIDFDTI
jgi:hypothetical protein